MNILLLGDFDARLKEEHSKWPRFLVGIESDNSLILTVLGDTVAMDLGFMPCAKTRRHPSFL
jgi:hypothetical protein